MKKAFRVKEFGLGNNKVIFFFAGMGTRTWLYTLPIKRLVDDGYRVIAYDFDLMIVRNGDADSFLRTAQEVSQSVGSYIGAAKKHKVSHFASFGVSMGTLLAIKCAAEHPEISKVIINMTYGSVAENIWTWWFIKPAKLKAISQGHTMNSLDQKLAPVSPIPNAKKLKGKQLLLYLSKPDKILLHDQSIQFKQALEKYGVDYRYIENQKHGHIVAGYLNMRNYKTYLDFLNS